MRAVILAIGDELTLGQAVDSNSAWLSARLAEQGILTAYHETVPDDLAAMVEALRRASAQASLVLLTGGLGPTPDDLTRPALAQALGVPLTLHAPSLERIAGFFRALGREMTESNRSQAMRPQGAEVLDNACGTAPGLKVKLGRAEVFALPGVPREMEDMFARHVLPALRPAGRGTVRTRALHTFGAGESAVAERLGDLLRRGRNPQVGTTVSKGIVTVRVRSEAATPAAAARALDETCRAVRQRLGVRVFGADEDTLEAVTGRLLRERGKTVALAESCTGGLVAKLLTDVAGASDYFLGGWVAYANLLKQRELGVRAKTLAAHGAVSEAVAREMAEGALQRAGANLALSLTGIAGPAGGTEEKPVGTVWIALARREGSRSQSSAQSFRFAGDRESVRERAARTALNMLRLYLLETPA